MASARMGLAQAAAEPIRIVTRRGAGGATVYYGPRPNGRGGITNGYFVMGTRNGRTQRATNVGARVAARANGGGADKS